MVDAVVRIFFCAETQERHPPCLVETFRFDLMFMSPEQVAGIVAMGKQIFARDSMIDELSEISCPQH